MIEKISNEEILKDCLDVMDTAYNELVNLIRPVMHTNLKYREAVKFVQSGKLVKTFDQIKKIVLSHQYLRGRQDSIMAEERKASNLKKESQDG